jgi:opacity protein-like surface antigen
MKSIIVIAIFIVIFTSSSFYAQCSDAGACSIDSHLNMNNDDKQPKYSLGFNCSLSGSGKTDGFTYNLFRLNGGIALNETYSVSVQIPFLIQDNSITNKSSSGIGDAIISLNSNVYSTVSENISIISALKVPTSAIDKKNFGYLNGYGTLDFISGVEYNFSSISASLLFQLPLNSYEDEMQKFKRGGDLVLNLEYSHYMDDWKFNALLLAIKRLSKSEIMFASNPSKSFLTIPDSDFFQLNIGVGLEYKVSEKMFLSLSGAIPVMRREDNSDGTKRAYSIQTGIRFLLN